MGESYGVNAAEILDALPERVIRYRLSDLTIVYCNRSCEDGYDLTPACAVGRNLNEFLSADGRLGLAGQLARLSSANPLMPDVVAREDLTAPGRWIEWVDRLLPNGEVIAVGRDVTEKHQIAVELGESEARFRELADQSSDMVFRFLSTPVPHFDYLSPSAEKLTGYAVQAFIDDFNLFVDTLDAQSQVLIARAISGEMVPKRSDICGRRADGSNMILEVHFTAIRGGLQGVGIDVTEIRAVQAELAEQALHDALTGLANRRLVDELMAVGLARAERQGTQLAVGFVDLDDFKKINDTYGHDAGDAVLREAARRMLTVARSADIVARMGGDEFLIVFEPNESSSDNLIARVESALAAPIAIAPSVTVTCPASIGYADTRTCGRNAAALLAAADADMYKVKRAHRKGGAA